jgi:hypothetical protein
MPVCDHCKEKLKTVLRPMQDNGSIKEYSNLFSIYIKNTGLRPDSELAKTRFVAGLLPANRVEIDRFGKYLPSIANIISYLTSVEDFKSAICQEIETQTMSNVN